MRRVLAGAAVTGAVLLFACLGPTQITLHVTTDLACARLKDTAIYSSATALDAPIASTKDCSPTGAGADIGTLVLTPSGDRDEAFTIAVVMGLDVATDQCAGVGYAGCIVAKRRVRYVAHESLDMPIEMNSACVGLVCDPSQTCFRGACVSAEVAALNGCLGPDCNPQAAPSPVVDGAADAPRDVATISDGPTVTPPDAGGASFILAGDVPSEVSVRGLHLGGKLLYFSAKNANTMQTSVGYWDPSIGFSTRVFPCSGPYEGYGVTFSGGIAAVANLAGSPKCETQCTIFPDAGSRQSPNCSVGMIGIAEQSNSTVYVGPQGVQRGGTPIDGGTSNGYAEAHDGRIFYTRQTNVVELLAANNSEIVTPIPVNTELRGIAVSKTHFFVSSPTLVYAWRRGTVSQARQLLTDKSFVNLEDLAYDEAQGDLYLAGRLSNGDNGIFRYRGFQSELP